MRRTNEVTTISAKKKNTAFRCECGQKTHTRFQINFLLRPKRFGDYFKPVRNFPYLPFFLRASL